MLPRIAPFSSAYLLCEGVTITAHNRESRIGLINPVFAEAVREHSSARPVASFDPRGLVYFRAPDSGGHIPAQMAEVSSELGLDELAVPESARDELIAERSDQRDLLVLRPTFAEQLAITAP